MSKTARFLNWLIIGVGSGLVTAVLIIMANNPERLSADIYFFAALVAFGVFLSATNLLKDRNQEP